MTIQWSLVLFTAIAGSGACLFACVGLDEYRGLTKNTALKSSLIALVLVIIGGFASLSHLSHPERVFGALGHPTSGIFTEALLLGLIAVAIIVYLVMLKRDVPATARKAVATIGIVLAVVFAAACGTSYMMASRETWNTVALPLGYLGTALAGGTALYAFLCAFFKEDEAAVRFAGTETLFGAIIALVLTGAYGFISGAAVGDAAVLFWVAVIICGAVAPAACGWVLRKKTENAVAYALIACVGALVGCVAFRVLMWIVGTAVMNSFGASL